MIEIVYMYIYIQIHTLFLSLAQPS